MTTTSDKRLIEVAFPLKQASLDSVHEKNVRHGHISTLHIWPARRPLAASRAALIATLLPDPGDPEKRKEILRRMAGTLVEKIEKKKVGGKTVEVRREETVGGILHWGRESSPDLEWFRQEIRKAYGGRAPKVLDPFAGGGAIPFEAIRLGCEVTAVDINPVAWFLLKCTLEYPQRFAGQSKPLPEFAVRDREFMESFLKAKGFKGALLRTQLERLGLGDGGPVQGEAFTQDDPTLHADLAWHVRAWGRWVLGEARKKLAKYYPTYAEFQAIEPGKKFEPRALRLVDTDENGIAKLDELNKEYDEAYLKDPRNPRWIAKPTVAYLWTRTVTCKQCRATVPLLKTRWLAKKDNKRVLLTMEPNADKNGVSFGVQNNVPLTGGNAAQRRENDKRISVGTMSRSGAACPCCGAIQTMEDIRLEGRAGRLGAVMTAVVVEGYKNKEYRSPTEHETTVARDAESDTNALFREIPFGLPDEATPKGGGGAARAFSVDGYGLDRWWKLFNARQLLCLGTLVREIRTDWPRAAEGLGEHWVEAVRAYIIAALTRLADYNSTICIWGSSRETIAHTFTRFALPITWDFCEANAISTSTGSFEGGVEWVSLFVSHALDAAAASPRATVICGDAAGTETYEGLEVDVVSTDPPYYDAIPYSDLADFFYVWMRRAAHGLSPDLTKAFSNPLGPKWDAAANRGELIEDSSRFGNDKAASKQAYENGMYEAFKASLAALRADGRAFVVFANKKPDAWETLVGSLIRAGATVEASWPIVTEMRGGVRNYGRASLASSVWLICKKRDASARPGWDTTVLQQMRANIYQRLREFWDAGISGPDFVWAATGPALEAYSQHPIVKKADQPNQTMNVSEFLREVRRIVVDFVVGRVLSREGDEETMIGLDDVTTYYLLHRHDFGMDEAPVGACILYATACNLSDRALTDQYDLLARAGGHSSDIEDAAEEEDEDQSEEADAETEHGTGATVKLKAWNQRKGRNLGLEASAGQPVPLIDQVHKLMHLWKAGEEVKVDEYIEARALGRNALFAQLLQALIELSVSGSSERSILESLSNHLASHGGVMATRQQGLAI